ncbi:MAG: D-alanyl-D-alanine carboxypeptidase/D-alanyl-D-alanine endopeptidase [Myxococcota bacterium]
MAFFARCAAVALVLVVSLGAPSAVADAAKAREREALRKALVESIQRSSLKAARVSAQVVSLEDGAVVFGQNADELLNPASNVKLVTAAVALARLGLDFRFDTELLTDEPLKDGKTKVLYVRGKGDPTLTTERLYGIVGELLHTGLKEAAELVVDDSYFDAERLAPGYDQESSDRSYMAPTGALSLNWNAIGVYLRPGNAVGAKAAVELEPPSEYFVVDSSLTTGKRHLRRFAVSSKLDKDKGVQRIEVRGSVPFERGTWSVWKKIDEPALYFGHTLKAMLAQRGVKVKRVRPGTVPPAARMLYVSQSDTLDIVLKRLNKHSSNFVAEQLVKTLGAEVKGLPGSTAQGIEVIEEFLEKEVGLARGSYVMKNGSGLNDTNRFSAAQLVKVLRHMYGRFPLASEYLSAVAIAGKDGTLRYRFEGSDAVGRLRAKTGTLENVSALSGYVQAVGNELFAFSVVVNDFPGRAGTVVQHIDALGAMVASTGSARGPDSAVAALTPSSVVGPIDELKSRSRTYLAMGRQGDKRNISFLRTAWRNEKDPAVRAVVAEALYLSDPQDYLGARMLVDSFAATEEVYGRLRKVALALSEEVPGIASLAELGSGGNLEALGRLLEVARAAVADETAQEPMAETLAEVARSAPDELLLAMRGASEAEAKASTALLARGLVKDADPEHPFWPALRRSMGALDAELAAFARRTEAELSLEIALVKAPPAAATTAEETAPPKVSPEDARPGG